MAGEPTVGRGRLSRRNAVRDTAFGVGGGALLLGLPPAVLVALGAYGIGTGSASATDLLVALGMMVLVAFGEEVLYRLLLLRILEDGLGSGIALVLSSVLFGALHLGNPDATVFGAVKLAAGTPEPLVPVRAPIGNVRCSALMCADAPWR